MVLLSVDTGFIATFFNNITKFVKAMGSYVVLGVGLVLIIFGVLHLVKALASRKAQSNWTMIILCILLGGVMAFGGWKILTTDVWGKLGKDTTASLLTGNTPTAIAAVGDGSGSTTISYAQTAINVIMSGLILPFGKALAVCTGVLLIIIACWLTAKHYISSGKVPIPWSKIIGLCLFGSVLFASTPVNDNDGWTWVKDILIAGAKDSVVQITDGGASTQNNGLSPVGFRGADPEDVP